MNPLRFISAILLSGLVLVSLTLAGFRASISKRAIMLPIRSHTLTDTQLHPSHSPSLGLSSRPDSVDIIIEKYINAMGGKEKLASVKTLYLEGTVNNNGVYITVKSWTVNNKNFRTESSLNGFITWKVLHTDSAWSFNPRRGQKFPQPEPADEVRSEQPYLDLEGTLVDYKTKGYEVEYKGIDQIEGSDVYKLEETLNETVTRTFYIDLDSYLIIRMRSKLTTKRRTSYSNSDYSNYQKTADGYVFPMEINRAKYKIVKVNMEMADSLFVPRR